MNSTRLQVHQIFGFRNFQKFSFEKFDGVPRGECCLYRCMHFRELFLQWHFSRVRNDDEYPQRRWIIWKLLTRFKKNIIINNFYLILGPPQFHKSVPHKRATPLPPPKFLRFTPKTECWTEGFLVLNWRILEAEKAWPFCVELMCWTEGVFVELRVNNSQPIKSETTSDTKEKFNAFLFLTSYT